MPSMSTEYPLCPLQQAAETAPHALVFRVTDKPIPYAECNHLVNQCATVLKQQGLREGEAVALLADSTPASVMLLLACIRSGILAFPLNPRFPQDFIHERMQALSCKNLVRSEKYYDRASYEDFNTFSLESLVVPSAEVTGQSIVIPPHRPATMVLTSGSAAAPKAAVHSLENHLANAARSNRNLPLQQGDRWLMSLPLHHVAGLGVLFRCLLAQATIAFPAPGEGLKESILRTKPTHLSLVATQLYRLLHDETTLPALQACTAILLGGGPVPEKLLQQAYAAKLPIYTTYGLTEAATQISTTCPGDSLEHLLSSGKPLFPKDFRITADSEIQIRGESLFLGYREGDTLTRPESPDGWFATRDRGSLDTDGYLHIQGRLDNMFIAGGENIQPESIEAVLESLPQVQRAIVVPVPHPEFGNSPAAFILWEDEAVSLETLIDALRNQLPSYALPRHLFPWLEAIDKDRIKVPRHRLKAHALSLLTP